MFFCPACANVLLINLSETGTTQFYCQTCPYIYKVQHKISTKITLERKELDDVLGGPEAWEKGDKTEATCPKCEHRQAYFMQIQIRSADEPMSIFYKCCKPTCHHQWREG